MTAPLVIEGFAGPGGWSEGLRLAGFIGFAVGIEHDMSACRTATAAGHHRVRADVAAFPLEHLAGKVDGLIQSPPCQAFSMAGNQLGLIDQPAVFERMAAFAVSRTPPEHEWADARSQLTAEPMRWAVALKPRWIVLEQVPPVLPLWQYAAELLRGHGYRTWTGILSAEKYAVPQTRKRAFLLARRDGLPVGPPEPTRQAYRAGRDLTVEPDLFGDPLPPPVSMAEALGWGLDDRPAWTVTSGGTESGGAEVFGNANNRRRLAEIVAMAPGGAAGKTVEPRPAPAPAHTITGKGTAAWVLRNGNQDNACERRACEPAGTLFFGARTNAVDVVSPEGTRRVTVQEAAILQSFRPDYPWQGTKSQQYQQVGNAVPPLLAAAVLRQFMAGAA